MREAMLAFLTEGSTRKAAAVLKAAGRAVPYRTIAAWAASEAGKQIIEELRVKEGASLAEDLTRIVRKQLVRYEAALDEGKIAPRDLPVHSGIYLDKIARLAPKAEPTSNEFHVAVRFGGVRVSAGAASARDDIDPDAALEPLALTTPVRPVGIVEAAGVSVEVSGPR